MVAELDCAFNVDVGEVEHELGLGVEDLVGLLEGDAESAGQARSGIGENRELELCLLDRGQRLDRHLGLIATSRAPDEVNCESRSKLIGALRLPRRYRLSAGKRGFGGGVQAGADDC